MKTSIYKYTKDKLLTHGVCKTSGGQLILSDKKLFLKFVKLERAVRLDDFESIQTAVQNIERYSESIGKAPLVLFAYLYLYFSNGLGRTEAKEFLEGGRWRRVVNYRREVTPTERLISDWASIWWERYSKAYFRALYSAE